MIYNCKDIYDNPSEYDELLNTRGYLIYGFHNTINDKWYIGDTKGSVRSRLFKEDFVGWGHFVRYKTSDDHLYRSMRKYGLDKFTFEILYKGEYGESIEEDYIKKYDSFNNGYNSSPDGKSFDKGSATSGRIIIHNNDGEKFIKPNELSYYESLGYKLGRHPNNNPFSNPEVKKKANETRRRNDNYNYGFQKWNTQEAIKKRTRRFDWIRSDGSMVYNMPRNTAGKYQKKYGEKWVIIKESSSMTNDE